MIPCNLPSSVCPVCGVALAWGAAHAPTCPPSSAWANGLGLCGLEARKGVFFNATGRGSQVCDAHAAFGSPDWTLAPELDPR